MPPKILTNDLDNCLINFDRKVLVTNLLDEYGGLLEEIAKTVNEYLSTEEAKGKKFEKTFLLRGLQSDSNDEVITLVPERKLKHHEQQLRDVHSMLYSAETAGGSKSPATEFMPLKHFAIKLDNLEVKEATASVSNGTSSVVSSSVKEEKQQPAKKTGALGAMFKKQEANAPAKKSPPEKSKVKNAEPEKKINALGAMFKKQETAAANKTPQSDVTFKKQESSSTPAKKITEPERTIKSTPDKSKKTGPASKKSNVLKPSTPKGVNKLFNKEVTKKPKEEPAANVSVNLFEESTSSSDNEETWDALKRQVLTDDEEEKPSTSSKRRRIIDSDDEDTGPEVKIERKEAATEDDRPSVSSTFMDDDGFIVTVKAKNKKPASVSKPTPTPVKIKKSSPKSPAKKEAPSKTPAAKKKQGNIMNFFTKK